MLRGFLAKLTLFSPKTMTILKLNQFLTRFTNSSNLPQKNLLRTPLLLTKPNIVQNNKKKIKMKYKYKVKKEHRNIHVWERCSLVIKL